MPATPPVLTASEAAERLGVSAKALRLYEARGLISPARTEAGWRCYRAPDLEAAAEIAALRKLGLSLREVERVLGGDRGALEAALSAHERRLEQRAEDLSATLAQVRRLRAEARAGRVGGARELADLVDPSEAVAARFALPWPWGGETFALRRPAPLTFIIGPLASGKTRLARAIADALPDAAYLDLARSLGGDGSANRLQSDPDQPARIEAALAWLRDEGAAINDALVALISALEAATPRVLVADLVEAGLAGPAQEALGAYLRHRRPAGRPLFAMTRSSAIFDLDQAPPETAVIFCPPNHSPPVYVPPVRGAAGYEAVRLCLAPPDVRERTKDVVAIIRREDP